MDEIPAVAPDEDYKALFDLAPCGFLSMTVDGLIVTVNQTMLDWIGYERDELVGRLTFADLLTAGGRIYHETHYAPTLKMQGSAREIALDIVCADGRRLPALVNSTLDVDEEGGACRIRTAVFDATERRSYERELLAAKRRAEESEVHASLLSRTLQQTLIPPEIPHIPGLDVAAVYRPAGDGEEIGGDFYDVFQIGVDDWMVAIGDVQGKGANAAVVTALARFTIRAAAVEHVQPSDVLHVVNDVLLRYETDRLCTAVVLRCRRRHEGWSLTVSCAGHPLPMLATAGSPAVDVGRPGTILGFFEQVAFHDVEIALDHTSTLLAYTDGVSEARRGREYFGEQRIRDLVVDVDCSAADVAGALVEEVLDFQGDRPRDDIAIIAIRLHGDHPDVQRSGVQR